MRGRGGNGRRRRRDVVVSQNGANHCSVVLISTVAAGKMCSLLYIAVPLNDRPRTKTTPRWRCPHYILYHPLLRPSRSFTFSILISFFLIFSAVAWYSFQTPPTDNKLSSCYPQQQLPWILIYLGYLFYFFPKRLLLLLLILLVDIPASHPASQ